MTAVGGKKILKIGSETRELGANLYRQFLHFLKFPLFSTFFIEHSGVLESKIFRANAHMDVAYHWKAYTL